MTTKLERPAKRAKLLSDDEDSSSENESVGGVILGSGQSAESDEGATNFKINEDYAKRFEHNKKREERHRLEEKYKGQGRSFPGQNEDDSESDSTSEEEDDDGDLVTGVLDDEIFATLKALKSKDPRIYDKGTTFYRPMEETTAVVEKKEKPLHLKDYHRQNLLDAANGREPGAEEAPQTYAQEQDALKRDLVHQMHSAVADMNGVADEDEGDGEFLQKKSRSTHDSIKVHPSRRKGLKDLDIDNAEKDPETFLSNFMAARAWVPEEGSRFAHLDSDDSEEERRAEGFEEAYNMRFEDPENANAKLMSYSRDTAKFSARREEKSGRQKQREKEREIKDAAKKEQREEKARLRKLRIEEVEQKVKQIKEAAGLGPSEVLNIEEWSNVLDDDFDDSRWEEEMQRRFGDKYYAQQDEMSAEEEEDADFKSKTTKAKKPTWDDDIDIKDLVPEFDEGEEEKPAFTLTDDELNGAEQNDDQEASQVNIVEPSTSSKPKSRKEQHAEKKRAARKQRQAIESLVDQQLTTSAPSISGNKGFQYRETSPVDFGLSARDILFADDAALNSYAGLKKTHAFRDPAKKARDKKKLGKKARLREWRRETFGNDEGYTGDFADFVRSKTEEQQRQQDAAGGKRKGHRDERDGSGKRSRKQTSGANSIPV
ncbi:hypothetical protein ANO11243_002470 [Dothideomycetidae sp. 11243]|nr:hypothetical protein ANO11243_002470 [fungal sp. No.11243]